MNKADIAITSGGRTVLELASLNVPTMVICQNARETTHEFLALNNGVINLGSRKLVEDADIFLSFRTIVENKEERMVMIEKSKKKNLTLGKFRVVKKIIDLLEG